MRRIVLITSGGDWSDASADLLAEPEGRNLEADVASYPGYHKSGGVFLTGWLERLGYERPTAAEAVEIDAT